MQTQQAYNAVINDFNYYLNISTKFGLYLNIPFLKEFYCSYSKDIFSALS